MTSQLKSIRPPSEPQHELLEAVPASEFSFDELVDIYNQTRVDYIVPMPMNAQRLMEYTTAYNVNLEASIVVKAKDQGKEILAISMLGLRGHRAWITRLGVLPVRRRMGTGQFIMDHHIYMAQELGANQIQLEVIKDNAPAHKLFSKTGFQETRELLIIRRPPSPIAANEGSQVFVEKLNRDEILEVLEDRQAGAAWTEESSSLLNAEHLIRGIRVHLPSGEVGRLVYQSTLFQLSHLVFDAASHQSDELAYTLLLELHRLHPNQDTKIENVPLLDPLWQVYRRVGYLEVFRRIEMVMNL